MFEPLPFLLEVVVGLVVVVVRVMMLPVVVVVVVVVLSGVVGVVGVVVVVGADANTAAVVVFKAQSHGSRAVSETGGKRAWGACWRLCVADALQ